MAITNENLIRGTDLVTASQLIPGIPGFCRPKSNVPTPGSLRTIESPTAGIVSGINSPPLARTPPPPTGFTLIGALMFKVSCVTPLSILMQKESVSDHLPLRNDKRRLTTR